uniref:Uncharacterized protein n=2 Tax=Timema TaxID=61471 RepID=A0A7R9IGN7_9NEOP|nr:unnamed protein product [Timema bartmani]CAD7457968.1 unnamed protein product [Timema tahoe]
MQAEMSAGSQIQMAPQGNLNSGQPVHSQDSNMSTVVMCLTSKRRVRDASNIYSSAGFDSDINSRSKRF